MGSWAELEIAEPAFARRVLGVLAHRKHKALATLRRDGSPRLSGIEVELEGGELLIGMMPDSRKLADLRRDPRVSLLALSEDPVHGQQLEWGGDVQIRAKAVELPSSEGPPRFRLDLDLVALTSLGGSDYLLIESWRPGEGLVSLKRY